MGFENLSRFGRLCCCSVCDKTWCGYFTGEGSYVKDSIDSGIIPILVAIKVRPCADVLCRYNHGHIMDLAMCISGQMLSHRRHISKGKAKEGRTKRYGR